MIKINKNYLNLNDSYLFSRISERANEYKKTHPGERLLLLGVGDVTQPLCNPVIDALHSAVSDQAEKTTFHGYMPECGTEEFRQAVKNYYKRFGVSIEKDEIFSSSGAGDDLGDVLDLFASDNTALVPEPTYPAYVDTNIMAGHSVIHLPTCAKDGFVPVPDNSIDADIIYLCSPNNPTGAAYDRRTLTKWVEYALKKGAIIIFDAAYEAFIQEPDIPHSIYEIDGSRKCAIEICSLSKTAGFTGMRCGYTVVPKDLVFDNISLNKLWVRNRTTKTNGISYVLQRAAIAALSDLGIKECQNALDVYRKNAKMLMGALDKCNIRYFGGKNAPYIWIECPENMYSWNFFDFMLEKAKIVGTPGEGFGQCGKNYFRLSAFGNPDDTALAADRICKLFAEE